jgi:Ca2+-binding EF-hand superfamily protein
MFAKLDPDGVGWVDAGQFVAHRARRFGDFDTNHDGKVTLAEYRAKHPDMAEERLLAHYGEFDATGSGSFTQAQWDAAELTRFRRIDADGDGRVTRDEFLADRLRVCATN